MIFNIETCNKISLCYDKKQCGIYCIRNKINNKFYIGSSQNAYHRVKSQHFHRLQNKTHTNPHLQLAWNKYGKNNFELFLIEECDKSNLIQREQWYLDNSGCLNRNIGYNINILAECTILTPEQCKKISQKKIGHYVSDECKRKISQSLIGKNSGKNHHNYGKRPIYQYTKNRKYICSFNSLPEAVLLTGIGRSSIKSCYRGKTKTGGKFIWERP
jgi:predicted GIY-YIG superfamily endonuclease